MLHPPKRTLRECSRIVDRVQKRSIVVNESAGQNTQVSSFAIALSAPSGKILYLYKTKPTAMQRKSVSIGFKVAENASIVAPVCVDLLTFYHE